MLSFPVGLPPSLVYSYGAFGESTHGIHGAESYQNGFWVMNGITSGSGVLEIAGKTIKFSEKSVLLVPPDIPHRYHFNGLVTKTYAHFRVANTEQTAPIPEIQNLEGHYAWYRTSILDCRKWVLTAPERSLATLWYLLWQLTAGPVESSAPRQHPIIQSLLRYLDANLGSPLSVGKLAAAIGASPSHLNRLCQSAFGLPTATLVKRLRLEQAIHLLSHTKEPISDIAWKVGYPDLQHFNKLIRSFTGRSPRQHRREGNPTGEAAAHPVAADPHAKAIAAQLR